MAVTNYFVWYWETFGVWGILIFVVLLGFVFRKYLGALFLDYVVDGLGSFLDNLIGIGIMGLDVGDFIAGIIIFFRFRKSVGNLWAFIALLEAWNFFLGFIPGVGEVFETIFGFIPAVTLLTLFFSKEDKAKEEGKSLEKNLEIAKNEGIETEEGKSLEKIKKLLEKRNFVEALENAKKANDSVKSRLNDYVDETNDKTMSVISQVGQQESAASGELKNLLDEGIAKSQELIQEAGNMASNENYESAVIAAKEAMGVIKATVEEYNKNLK